MVGLNLKSIVSDDVSLETDATWETVLTRVQITCAWLVVVSSLVAIVMNRVAIPAWVVPLGVPQSDVAVVTTLLASTMLVPLKNRLLIASLFFGTWLVLIATFVAKATPGQQRLLTIWAADPYRGGPVLMSWLSLAWLTLIALTMTSGRLRHPYLRAISSALCMLSGMLLVGISLDHMFSVSNLVNGSPLSHVSAVTMVSFLALLAAWVAWWARFGQWHSLCEAGLAASTLRLVSLISILLPILFAFVIQFFGRYEVLSVQLASAIYVFLVGFVALAVGILLFEKLRALEINLHRDARVDSLTGIGNLRAADVLKDALQDVDADKSRSTAAPGSGDRQVTVCIFDLDDLKKVNDRLGHEIGSLLIQRFGNILKKLESDNCIPYRLGGDEFALVSLDCSDSRPKMCAVLTTLVDQENSGLDSEQAIRYSHGDATGAPKAISDLFRLADFRMYQQKRAKKQPD